jgi:polyisoprenoid-binding protein YceI
MKLNTFFALALLAGILVLVPTWKPDTTASKVLFTIDGPFGTVHGKFTGLKADIKFSSDDLNGSSVNASIDAKTVSTGIALRNRDLRNKEIWLNTDKYPLISFRSRKFEKKGNEFIAIGELTLKGKTKPMEIPFTFNFKGNEGVFKGKFTINREDFDVGKKGGSVGKTISIDLTIPVEK